MPCQIARVNAVLSASVDLVGGVARPVVEITPVEHPDGGETEL